MWEIRQSAALRPVGEQCVNWEYTKQKGKIIILGTFQMLPTPLTATSTKRFSNAFARGNKNVFYFKIKFKYIFLKS